MNSLVESIEVGVITTLTIPGHIKSAPLKMKFSTPNFKNILMGVIEFYSRAEYEGHFSKSMYMVGKTIGDLRSSLNM